MSSCNQWASSCRNTLHDYEEGCKKHSITPLFRGLLSVCICSHFCALYKLMTCAQSMLPMLFLCAQKIQETKPPARNQRGSSLAWTQELVFGVSTSFSETSAEHYHYSRTSSHWVGAGSEGLLASAGFDIYEATPRDQGTNMAGSRGRIWDIPWNCIQKDTALQGLWRVWDRKMWYWWEGAGQNAGRMYALTVTADMSKNVSQSSSNHSLADYWRFTDTQKQFPSSIAPTPSSPPTSKSSNP